MIVVDCSLIVDALIGPDAGPIVERISEEQLAAPALIDFEFVSALRGLTMGRHVSDHLARDVLADFEQLAIDRWGLHDALRRRTFELRGSITAYDAAYVTLAEALACPLLTRDRKLARAAKRLVDVETV